MFNFLIDNIYISCLSTNSWFSIGTDFVSSVVDIFLFSYKYQFMNLLISTDFSIAAIPTNVLMTCNYHSTAIIIDIPDPHHHYHQN